MSRFTIAVAIAAGAILSVSAARADYAVMRSGARIHITGYQQAGDRMELTVSGGTVEVAASDVVSIEPEESFEPNRPAAMAVSGRYAELIRRAAAKHGIDELLIQRVIAEESNFNPRAVSRKDALGLMQLLPKTAARYAVANVFDPAENIEGGTRYLKDLLERYRGNLSLALAAYNAGPEMVEQYRGIPPFPETQNYVRRIIAELAKAKAKDGRRSVEAVEFASANKRDGIKGQHRASDGAGISTASAGSTAVAPAAMTAAAGPSAASALESN